jgi:hypothetical protein
VEKHTGRRRGVNSMVAQVGCDEGGEMVEPRNQHAGRQKRNRVQAGLQHRERPYRPRVDG